MKRQAIGGNISGKRSRSTEDEWVEDVFHSEKTLDIENDKCALCKQGHQFGVLLKRALDVDREESEVGEKNPNSDVDGVWVSRYSLSMKVRVFVHFYCAFTCPRAWFTIEGNWRGVQKEVSRGRQLTCSDCKEKGATIGCIIDSCGIKMHLPCAMKNGFRMSRYTNNNFVCKKHRLEKEREDEKKNSALPSDFTRGKEKIPIHCENRIDSLDPLDNFTYVTENIDSDDLALNSRSVNDLPCCSCTDLCSDATKCACLANGRNYTLKGTLAPHVIASPDFKIVECNLRCDCSIRRCTNRVVSKGLAIRLTLFRTGSSSQPWGVRLLESVEANTFICEVNGQVCKAPTSSTSSSSSSSSNSFQYPLPRFGQFSASEIFCIDCSSYGNIARYIRKRASGAAPMLQKKFVYDSWSEDAIPRLALFSTKPLEKGQELFL